MKYLLGAMDFYQEILGVKHNNYLIIEINLKICNLFLLLEDLE
jgi:hypothetical protein